jgi:DNA-binding protein YbaB
MADELDPGSETERLIARMGEQVEEARRRAAALGEVRERVTAVKGSARSDDRSVQLTVDSAGRLLDVRLTDDALDRGPDALGRELVRLAREAVQDAAAQVAAIDEQAYGAGSETAAFLRSTLAPPEDDGLRWSDAR